MPVVKVYRTYRSSENGGLIVDELMPEDFPCNPDEFDEAEGVTTADMALEVLNLKIYAEEASSFPDWQRGTWYSRTETVYDECPGADTLETSAILVNFSDTEALEIFKRFNAR